MPELKKIRKSTSQDIWTVQSSKIDSERKVRVDFFAGLGSLFCLILGWLFLFVTINSIKIRMFACTIIHVV